MKQLRLCLRSLWQHGSRKSLLVLERGLDYHQILKRYVRFRPSPEPQKGLSSRISAVPTCSVPNAKEFQIVWSAYTALFASKLTTIEIGLSYATLIPKELGSMAALKKLDLSACRLFGTIPQELGTLKSIASGKTFSSRKPFDWPYSKVSVETCLTEKFPSLEKSSYRLDSN
ncbi:hypothetical protein BDR26DRAFT_940419 [Obelidium mucronatum]|nr:hypothetical protein BDR26DRAFT_940419 [Obelidium mucronatum]